jgi:hypothetical protein
MTTTRTDLRDKAASFLKARDVGHRGDHAMLVGRALGRARMPAATVAVGYLHDAVEDGLATHQEITDAFGDDVARSVVTLTRAQSEAYDDYMKRVLVDPVARAVKLADATHNLSRCPESLRRRYEKVIATVTPIVEQAREITLCVQEQILRSQSTPGTSDEYYTPSRFLDLGRFWVGGDFDLDPASTELANRMLVRADRWIDSEENGLSPLSWRGARRVWCNPPFSDASAFSARLLRHQLAEPESTLVLLTNSVTEATWWQMATVSAGLTILVRGRPVFLDPIRMQVRPDADESEWLTVDDKGRPQTGRSGISLMFFGSGPPALDLMKRASELGIDGVWM